jgi:hypothetical protein
MSPVHALRVVLLPLFVTGVLAACAAPTSSEPEGSTDSALTGTGQGSMAKNDHKSKLYSGGTLEYEFYISAGDTVTAQVSVPGTASAWITDGSNILATGSGSGSNSRVTFTAPPGGYTDLRIVFSGTATGSNYSVTLSTAEGPCVPGASYLHDMHPVRQCPGLQSLGCQLPMRQYQSARCGCGCEDPA